MTDHFIQLVILICSLSVATLSSFREVRIRRWGFVASLCGQPFWFWTAFKHNQWGIMLLAFYFAAMAMRGIWTHRSECVEQCEEAETIRLRRELRETKKYLREANRGAERNAIALQLNVLRHRKP